MFIAPMLGVKISNGEMSVTMFSSSGISAALLSSLVFSLSPSLFPAVTLGVASGQVLQLGSSEKGQFRSSAL